MRHVVGDSMLYQPAYAGRSPLRSGPVHSPPVCWLNGFADDAGGGRALNNLTSQSELSRDATAPGDHAAAEEESAPLQSPPALLPESDSQDSPSVGSLEIPVASIQPPVALFLPDSADHALLENRIQRLEAELVRMRNSATAETRMTRQEAPGVVHESGGFWSRLLGPSGPAKTTRGTSSLPSMLPPGVRHTWLLLEALAELRAMYWMFFDPRYHLSWAARLAPPVIVALILTSYYWTPGTSLPFFVGTVVEKLCDLILAYFLFKLLSYESRRYRETAPDLPHSLRL